MQQLLLLNLHHVWSQVTEKRHSGSVYPQKEGDHLSSTYIYTDQLYLTTVRQIKAFTLKKKTSKMFSKCTNTWGKTKTQMKTNVEKLMRKGVYTFKHEQMWYHVAFTCQSFAVIDSLKVFSIPFAWPVLIRDMEVNSECIIVFSHPVLLGCQVSQLPLLLFSLPVSLVLVDHHLPQTPVLYPQENNNKKKNKNNSHFATGSFVHVPQQCLQCTLGVQLPLPSLENHRLGFITASGNCAFYFTFYAMLQCSTL